MRPVVTLVCIGWLIGTADAAQPAYHDSLYAEQIRVGIALSFQERFEEAAAIFRGRIIDDSTDYAAYAFLAAVLHSGMMDREDFAAADSFNLLIDKSLQLADAAARRGENAAWAFFVMGSAHAYRAALKSRTGSWWSAMREGLKAKNRLLDALRIEPQFYDAYVGLGNYHYWKSTKTEFINWLPLIGDRKDEGIDELLLAVDSSLFSQDIALNSLIWIYLDRRLPATALHYADRLHQKYPDSRLAKWGLAFSHYQAGNLREAADYFGEILEQLESDTTQNGFNLIECRYHRGRIYEALGDNERMHAEFQALLRINATDDVKRRQKAKLRSVSKL